MERDECRRLLGSFSAYLDGETEARACQAIETHLASCEDCRVVVDTLRKTISLYHECADETAEIPHEVRSQLFKTLNLQDYLE